MKKYIIPIATKIDVFTDGELMTNGIAATSGEEDQYTNKKNNTWDESEESNSNFWGESAFESK